MEKVFCEYYWCWYFCYLLVVDLCVMLIDVFGKFDVVNQVFDQVVYGIVWVDDVVIVIDIEEVMLFVGMVVVNGQCIEIDVVVLDKQFDKQCVDWKKVYFKVKFGEGLFFWCSIVIVCCYGVGVLQILCFIYVDGSYEDLCWNDDCCWVCFVVIKLFKVVFVEFDLVQMVYLDVNKFNDSYVSKLDGSVVCCWVVDVVVLLQNFYFLLGIF